MKMGQNKLESDFRKKLNTREIEPSADAWSRLDAMLDKAEEKKSKNYSWLYIAAAIAAFILIATVIFNGEKSVHTNETGVAVENETEQINPDPANFEKQPATETEVHPLAPIVSPKSRHDAVAAQESADHGINKTKIRIKKHRNEAIASSDIKDTGVQSSIKNQSSINQNLQEIQPNAVTEIEQVAQNTPTERANPAKSTLKVDANSLLSQVDGELELSFREKVIKSVSKNYKEVKVALANRNLE